MMLGLVKTPMGATMDITVIIAQYLGARNVFCNFYIFCIHGSHDFMV